MVSLKEIVIQARSVMVVVSARQSVQSAIKEATPEMVMGLPKEIVTMDIFVTEMVNVQINVLQTRNMVRRVMEQDTHKVIARWENIAIQMENVHPNAQKIQKMAQSLMVMGDPKEIAELENFVIQEEYALDCAQRMPMVEYQAMGRVAIRATVAQTKYVTQTALAQICVLE